jgi:hypothetical protein
MSHIALARTDRHSVRRRACTMFCRAVYSDPLIRDSVFFVLSFETSTIAQSSAP